MTFNGNNNASRPDGNHYKFNCLMIEPCLVWALDNYVRDYKALKYYCIIELVSDLSGS